MIRISGCALFVVMALGPQAVRSQAPTPQLLDGMEIEYTYEDGGTVVANFEEGRLSYRWTSGPFAGTAVSDRIYQSRQLGEELYLVSWHDTENLNFATLVFDFRENREYGSALVGYGTDQETVLFDEAVIQRVNGRP